MKSRMLNGFAVTAALLFGSLAHANTNGARTDAEIAKQITHEVRMYSRYTLWDDVNFSVANGQVQLLGAVSQPFKKSDLQRIVQHVPGVTSVTNELKVLPLSSFDDRLRVQVARAVYSDPMLSRYAMGAMPSIHIIVDNGKVTLTGVVNTEAEKNVAGIRASGAGLSFGQVDNQLRVEHPAKRS
jgi:hyperosmotically inducible protein